MLESLDYIIGVAVFILGSLGVLNIVFIVRFRRDFYKIKKDFKMLCGAIEALACDLEEMKK